MKLSILNSQPSQTKIAWKHDLECHQSEIETLKDKPLEMKASIQCSEDDAKRELELLWCRVKSIDTLVTSLKIKARIMAVPHLTHTSCSIKHQEGVGFIDRHGVPFSDWSKDVDFSSFESSDEETKQTSAINPSSLDANYGAYYSEIVKSVQMITDVMESLVRRIIMAENEAAVQKENFSLGMEEIRNKTLQIESMSAKVEEMEKFALVADGILNEMRQRVDDMVKETSKQHQCAAENEQELSRVKQDFEALRSYVSSLVSVRETLISSEKKFQTMENLIERLMAKASHLEADKVQKEAEVQKLIDENVRLNSQLDKKEAQLVALNEQMKFMALNKKLDRILRKGTMGETDG